jgi:hypothetical protein
VAAWLGFIPSPLNRWSISVPALKDGFVVSPTATTSPLRGLCLKQALRCEGTEATQLDTRAARQSSGDLLEYVATVSSAMYRLRFLGHRIEPYAGLGWRLKLGLTEHVGR